MSWKTVFCIVLLLLNSGVCAASGESKATLPDGKSLFKVGIQQYLFGSYNSQQGNSLDSRRQALEKISNAAELGVPDAQFCMGFFWERGDLGRTDRKKAFDLYLEAVRMDFVPALLAAGRIYETGTSPVESPVAEKIPVSDREKALFYYSRAAGQGSEKGQYHAARLCLRDAELRAEPACNEGIDWLRSAVEQGSAEAQVLAGQLLAEGKVLHRNLAAAFDMFSYAAAQGYAEGQYLLGAAFFSGQGTPRNLPAACFSLKNAVNQGHSEAAALLGHIYMSYEVGEDDFERAFYYLEQAAAQGSIPACRDLAILCEASDDPARKSKAAEYRQRAGNLK